MGIGTSSSSSGASAPRANAYAVNRDASELGRSHAEGTASAQPGPMHVIYSADPDAEQLDCGTASAGCGPGAAGKTRVRSFELTGMAMMVAPGSGIGRVIQRVTTCLPRP